MGWYTFVPTFDTFGTNSMAANSHRLDFCLYWWQLATDARLALRVPTLSLSKVRSEGLFIYLCDRFFRSGCFGVLHVLVLCSRLG